MFPRRGATADFREAVSHAFTARRSSLATSICDAGTENTSGHSAVFRKIADPASCWMPSKPSIRTWKDFTFGMGQGWETAENAGHKVAFHNGGGATMYARLLDDRLTIVVLTNCNGAETDQIVGWLISHYAPEIAQFAHFGKR